MSQFVDFSVSKKKFDEQLGSFLEAKEYHRLRGINILKATFPNVFVSFSKVDLPRTPEILRVRVNLSNFDVVPPSVVILNLANNEPITQIIHCRTPFYRNVGQFIPFPLLQINFGKLPFICMPGIREYHNHPRHSGDSWFLHRNIGGEGSLGFIIEKLYTYGIVGIAGFVEVGGTIPVGFFGYIRKKEMVLFDGGKIPR